MKIFLSAHFDVARPVNFIKLTDKSLIGLVDNFAGVFVSYQASRKTGIPVYFTNFEELEYDGAEAVAKVADKDDLVIVVDTTKDAEGKDGYIGNAYGVNTTDLKDKFSDKILFKDGFFEETEDETWVYGKKYGLKTFYFGVPIIKDYHVTDNDISLESIDKSTKVLVELINFFR